MDGGFTPEQQARLAGATIGIAGAGGLGSNCAMHLVRAGVKRLVIVDFDRVEAGNLNRQFFFRRQIGMAKTAALAANLREIADDLNLTLHQEKVTDDNAAALFADCAIVVEAFDRPECKQLLIEQLLTAGKTVIAASGMAGWGATDELKTRRISDRFWLVGDLKRAVGPGAPPCSPRVGIAAAKEADVVLTLLLGDA